MDTVSFIFIETAEGASAANVASDVAVYEQSSGKKYVRWTAELERVGLPNSVIAAVRVPSQDELDSLINWISWKVEGVENVSVTTVPEGVHYSEVPEPQPLNGWP